MYNLLPRSKVGGIFNIISQLIFLNNFSKPEILKARTNPDDYLDEFDFFRTYYHETSHWLDITSTIWGREYLVKVYNALSAFVTQKESEFYQLVELHKEYKKNHYPSYYRFVHPHDPKTMNAIPWNLRITYGHEFGLDGKPQLNKYIPFARFSSSNNIPLCRIPISCTVLSETIAKSVEFSIIAEIMFQTNNSDDKSEIKKIAEKYDDQLRVETIKSMYNVDLAEYFVATHYLANKIHIYDVARANLYSSVLAITALNLPDDQFKSVKILNVDKSIEDIYVELLSSKHRGALFLILSQNSQYIEYKESVEDWYDEVLAISGLPKYKILKEMAENEIKKEVQFSMNDDLGNQLKYLLEVGEQNYSYRDWTRPYQIKSEKYIYPCTVLNDGSVMGYGDNIIDKSKFDPKRMHNLETEFTVFFNDFISACR